MLNLNNRDWGNIVKALKLAINIMDKATDGSDPIRTAIWRGRMADTLNKIVSADQSNKKLIDKL